MGDLNYKVSEKQLLEIRNKIFLEAGIPALKKNDFEKSPFSTAWYGKNNLGDYTYELCRLSKDSHIEFIVTHISKGDSWIKIFLNIFMLQPSVTTLEHLNGVDGLQYHLSPNNLTRMRLRIDDYKGIPLFRTKEHRLKSFKSEIELRKREAALKDLIEDDLTNIDSFVTRWHQLHKLNTTDWKGNIVSGK
ncbi:hypothetical protein [Dyadobacter sp. BHUBP1]|uniref:hypothetical protein n=1 Tax=Dyadobacter sp. BHUBP1 TaxID=3424178 RepID=UPI003D329834